MTTKSAPVGPRSGPPDPPAPQPSGAGCRARVGQGRRGRADRRRRQGIHRRARSGSWNVAAGHGRKELAAAAARQMETSSFARVTPELATRMRSSWPSGSRGMTYPSINRFFFTSGGGESNDSAFKTARYYWKLKGKPQKTKVISRQWGYHGVTLAAMSATGHRQLLADVRAACARFYSNPVAVPLSVPGSAPE